LLLANSEGVREGSCEHSQRFQRYDFSLTKSQGCSNPGLEFANAFSVVPRALSFHTVSVAGGCFGR